ncbi:triadin-like [Cloeon dipterum]|uniref:triadin-like n=1 Tax=Cloeon dipterum TaxID=197152 RepID=UPI00321F9DCE
MAKNEECGDSSDGEEVPSSSRESKNDSKANGSAKLSIHKSAPKEQKKKSSKNTGSSILTNEQLNIEVVKLRKTLKRIKMQTIQSIIRRIQKLKSAKEATRPKSKEKADNQLALLEAVKRLCLDETVKFAIITDEKECMSIISTETAAKKYVAMARVANTNSVRECIAALAKKYQNWDEMITKFYPGAKSAKRKAKRMKFREALQNKEKSNSIKTSKAEKKKKKPEETEKVEDSEEKVETKSAPAPKEKKAEESKPIKKPKAEKIPKQIEEEAEIPVVKAQQKEKPKSDNLSKTPKLQIATAVKTTIQTAVVKKLASLNDLVELEKPTNLVPDKEPAQTNKKDSFFLSSDGLEMSSEDEAEEGASESEEEFQDKSYVSRKYHMRSREETVSGFNGKSAEKSRKAKFQERETPQRKMGKKSFGDERPKSGKKEFSKPERSFDPEPEKLHPSWEAKRKQSAIKIDSAPTNKKIKFD